MSGRCSRAKWWGHKQWDNNWLSWQHCLIHWSPQKLNYWKWRSRKWNWRNVNWRSGREKWRSGIRKWRSGQWSPTSWSKIYHLQNPPTITYNDGRSNWHSMGWSNQIISSHDLHNVTKAYVKVVNDISTFLNPLYQPISSLMRPSWPSTVWNRDSKCWGNKSRLNYKTNCSSFMTAELLSQIILKTSTMNNEER